MSASTLFVIDDEPISIEQAFSYLSGAGKLQAFLQEILRQHAIARELQRYPELNSLNLSEPLLESFRRERQLLSDKDFQKWLENNRLSTAELQERLTRQWQLQQLKMQVSESHLHERFIERKQALDRFTLSWVVANSKELAAELYEQVTEGETPFEEIVKEHLFVQNGNRSGWRQPFNREELRDELKEAMKTAHPGQIIEPLAVNNNWYLVRVEEVVKASFEAVKEQLQTELFEDWLAGQTNSMSVKLEVRQWLFLKTPPR